MPEQAHPRTEEWIAFAQGTLPPERLEDLGAHLAACDTCCDLVRTVPEDEFVTLVRQADTLTAPAQETPPEGTIEFRPEDRLPGSLAAAPTQGDVPPTAAPRSGPTAVPDAPASEAQDQATIDSQVPLQGPAVGATLSLDAVLVDHPRYRIVRILGQGGMGAVYLAEHRLMHRTVALKIIRPDLVANPTAIERFRREFQAAARLHHPNIVTAHDAEEYADTHFLAMEYVEGTELADLLAAEGPLPLHQACDYVRQAALGLQHAHENGLAHRDIKPQNLMLTPAGCIKILDFGLAALAGEDAGSTGLTLAGTIMGTPDYIAPEQARDAAAADIRADIYSLGCTLYALIAGRVPFPDGKAMDKIVAHLQKNPPPIEKHRPDVPEGLRSVLARMMAKNRDDRFATPAEVAAALEPFCTPEGIEAARRPQRRRTPFRRVAALLAVAAGLIVAGVVLFLQTPHGTVRIEIGDPNIQVAFADRTFTVDDSGEPITVRPGEHTLLVQRGNLKFETPKFTLGRGANPALKVEFLAGQVVVRQGENELAKRGVPDMKAAQDDFTLVRTFDQGHPLYISSLALTPDGKQVLSGSSYSPKDTVLLWDLDTGKLVHRFAEAERPTGGVAVTSDGKYAVAGGINTLYVWDLPSRKLLHAIPAHKGIFYGVAVSPDGTRALTGGQDRTACLWDLATGKEIRRLSLPRLVQCVAFLPDGKSACLAGSFGCELWDVQEGKLLRRFGNPGSVSSLDVSPDGTTLAFATKTGAIQFWDIPKTALKRTLSGHDDGKVLTVRLLGTQRLLSGGTDGTMRLWDLDTGSEIARAHSQERVFNILAPTRDGKHVLSGGGYYFKNPDIQGTGDYRLRLWRLPESVWPKAAAQDAIALVRTFEGHQAYVLSLDFSPNGRWLVSGSGRPECKGIVWDATSGRIVSQFEQHGSTIFDVAFAPDNGTVAMAHWDGIVTLWDPRTGKETGSITGHQGRLEFLAFSPDGTMLATGTSSHKESHSRGSTGDIAVRIWNVADRKLLHRLDFAAGKEDHGGVIGVRFSPDGRRLLVSVHMTSGDLRNFVEEYQVGTWQRLRRLFAGSRDASRARRIRYSPDGRWIATGHAAARIKDQRWWDDPDNAVIRLWDAATGRLVRTLRGHRSSIHALDFSPDSRLLVSGSGYDWSNNLAVEGIDNSIRLWDVASGMELARQDQARTVQCVRFAPDGRHVASSCGGLGEKPLIQLWRLPQSVRPMEPAKDHRAHLTLKKGGPNLKLFLDGKEYPRGSDVVARLTERAQADPKLEVHLLGDVDLEDRTTRDLFGLLHGAGIQRIVLPPAVKAQLQAATRRLARQNDLKQIALALHHHHDAHGSFPPAAKAARFAKDGTPLLSWRVHLLPYLEEEELYRQFRLDEPWDSPHNRKLLDRMPKLFRGGSEDPTRTTIVAVVGPGTAYEGKAGFALKEIADGPSATILFVDAGPDKAVPWTKPEDLPFDPENPLRPLGTLTEGYLLAAFCDGAVREVAANQPPAALRALFTRAGKEAAPASTRLRLLDGMGFAGRKGHHRPGANPRPGIGVLQMLGHASTPATPPNSK